jgi:nitrite reductase/ring-hydroxylating ferredoxin subunit
MSKGGDVCLAVEVAPGEMKCVFAGETRILLANVDGKFCAVSDICSHAFASLSEGFLDGGVVECPLHGAKFDIATGKALSPPADKDLKTYEVTIVDGRIIVSTPETGDPAEE